MSENQDKKNNALKLFFKEKGLKQAEIAEILKVSQPAVGALLNGKPFGKKTAKIWGDLFGLEPNWLLTGVGPMTICNEKQNISAANAKSTEEKLLEIITKQQDTINHQQEVIAELIKKIQVPPAQKGTTVISAIAG